MYDPRIWHSRGYIPHIDPREVTQFITFRLADSMPQQVLKTWREDLKNGEITDARLRQRIETYIGLNRTEIAANLRSLRLLQRSHLLAVPFENLDIHWKRPIVLDLDRFYDKIVKHRRGGFCYELNGLFNEMLREIGFETRLISARVCKGGAPGREFDHAAIIVRMGDEEYLADVGFGDFTSEPLSFVLDEGQADATGEFMIRKFDAEYFEVAKRTNGVWTGEYIFKEMARDLAEFTEMCDFQQFSPESHFTKGELCSMMTEDGRKTLTDSRFITTAAGVKMEIPIDDEAHFYRVLNDEFGIERIQ
ncbi:MAG: arylamine N-acetyltransferase [Pyrinomonadaceae bacterium]